MASQQERRGKGEMSTPDKQSNALFAYHQLRGMIVAGQLRPGQILNEQDVVKYLKLGRTPVREAIHRLVQQGLVEVFPRRGYTVAKLSLKDVQEIFEAREAIETTIAALSAQRRSESEVGELADIGARINALAGDGDIMTFFRLDQDLHHLIASTARNKYLASHVDHLLLLSDWLWHEHLRVHDASDWDFFAHDSIIEAIIDCDSDRAAREMRRHVQQSREMIRREV